MATYFSYSLRDASTAARNPSKPSPVTLDTPTACEEMSTVAAKSKEEYFHRQVFVELVQYKTHAVHETVHEGWLSFRISRALVGR